MSHRTLPLRHLLLLALAAGLPLMGCGDDTSPSEPGDTGAADTGTNDSGTGTPDDTSTPNDTTDDTGPAADAGDTTDDDADTRPDDDDTRETPDGGPGDVAPDEGLGGDDGGGIDDTTDDIVPDTDVDLGPPRFESVEIPGPNFASGSWTAVTIFGSALWRLPMSAAELGSVTVEFANTTFALYISGPLGTLEAGQAWRASIDYTGQQAEGFPFTRAALLFLATPNQTGTVLTSAERGASERHPLAIASAVVEAADTGRLETELLVHERFEGMPLRLALVVQANTNGSHVTRFESLRAERRNTLDPSPPSGFYDPSFSELALDLGDYTDAIGGWRTPTLGFSSNGCSYMSVAYLSEALLPGGALVGTNVAELGSASGVTCYLAAPLAVPAGTTHVRASIAYTTRNLLRPAAQAALAIASSDALTASTNVAVDDAIIERTVRATATTRVAEWSTIEVCAALPADDTGALVLQVDGGFFTTPVARLVFDDIEVTPVTECPDEEL